MGFYMTTIKFFFALCIVGALGALTSEQTQKLKELRDTCIEETGVDRELVNKAHRGEWTMDDAKLRCFSSCFLKKMNSLSEDGNLVEDVTLSKMTVDVGADKAKEVLNKCKDITADDVCEKGMLLLKCYLDNTAMVIMAK